MAIGVQCGLAGVASAVCGVHAASVSTDHAFELSGSHGQ